MQVRKLFASLVIVTALASAIWAAPPAAAPTDKPAADTPAVDKPDQPPAPEPLFNEAEMPVDNAARIDGAPVTIKQLEQEIIATLPPMQRRQVLMSIVQRNLVEAEAAARKLTVTPEDMDKAQQDRMKQLGGRERYVKAIEMGQLDPKVEEINLHTKVLVDKMLASEPVAEPTEEELRVKYNRTYGEKYTLQVIVTGSTKKAGDLYQELKKGKDFGLTAQGASEHTTWQSAGIMPVVPVSELPKELLAAVQPLQVGEFCEPTSYLQNIWIVKVLDHTKADTTLPFEKVRKELADTMKRDRQDKRAAALMTSLFKKHKVEMQKGLFTAAVPDKLKTH